MHQMPPPMGQPTPPPQIILTLVGSHIQLSSNIAQEPGVWLMLAQILAQASAQVLRNAAEEQKGETSRILVPSIQLNGGLKS